MAKLWQRDYTLDKLIEEFTVGDDYVLDQELVGFDALGSIAHVMMLAKIGVLTKEEMQRIKAALVELIRLSERGEVTISREEEDVHTHIENYLTRLLGDLGKKVHTARSRNDQVLLDMRLYTKDRLLALELLLLDLVEEFANFAEKYADVPMPGRTHTQKAMPSSVGLWATSYAESLMDDFRLFQQAYELNDQCPLGSAASYGVPLPIDRQMVSDLLGFAKVQHNVLYANNSRGKMEAIVLNAFSQVMIDLSKVAQDVILFSLPELGYFKLADELCCGSSIMPQKRNPAGMELIRARCSTMLAYQFQVMSTIRALPSGYNRDFQETKAPFMSAVRVLDLSLRACTLVLAKTAVDEAACIRGCTPEIYATDEALRLVAQGKPFRKAYQEVKSKLDDLTALDPREALKRRQHVGGPTDLNVEGLKRCVLAERKETERLQKDFHSALDQLVQL